jgi:TraM recognition site of TraD and TraG
MVQRRDQEGGSNPIAATELVEWYSARNVPKVIDRAGGRARKRFLELFTATIRNENIERRHKGGSGGTTSAPPHVHVARTHWGDIQQKGFAFPVRFRHRIQLPAPEGPSARPAVGGRGRQSERCAADRSAPAERNRLLSKATPLNLHGPGGKPTPWDRKVERLLNGLREPHLYIGRALKDGVPWLLHRKLLHTHAHGIGGTGTGKTALLLSPLAAQLIARADSSVVVLDLKGDRSLMWSCFIEAERAGLPFRWFTFEPGCASFVFNPLTQVHDRQRTLNGRAQSLLTANGLSYGDDYGEGYYRAHNLDAFTAFLDKFRDIWSYADFSRYAEEPGSYVATNTDEKAASHMRMVLRQLATVEPLNVSENTRPAPRPEVLRDAIDMTDVLTEKQVVYFGLPSMDEELTATSVARQALYSLVQAAKIVNRTRKSVPVYALVDEAQQVLGQNTKILLEMARSMGVYLTLAHQSIDQLKTARWDIASTIEACTTFKLNFEASSLSALKGMEEYSGVTRGHALSWYQPVQAGFDDNDELFSPDRAYPQNEFDPPLFGIGEQFRPRLTKDEILAISAHPLRGLVRSRTDSGLTQYAGRWTEIECEFPTTEKEYEDRMQTPWPAEHPSCVTISADLGVEPTHILRNGPLRVPVPPRSVDRAIAERLKAHQDAIRRQYRPDES